MQPAVLRRACEPYAAKSCVCVTAEVGRSGPVELMRQDKAASESTIDKVMRDYRQSALIGYVNDSAVKEICSMCKGTGNMTVNCSNCGGDRKCEKCSGRGVLSATSGMKGCSLCNGIGKCIHCKGIGTAQEKCTVCGTIGDRLSAIKVRSALTALLRCASTSDFTCLENNLCSALGLMAYGGMWLPREEATNQLMTARGMVKYEDEWVAPREVTNHIMAARGLVEYDDEWVTPRQMTNRLMTSRGFVEYDDEWVTPREMTNRLIATHGYVEYDGELVTPREMTNRIMTAHGLVMYRDSWLTAEEKTRCEEIAASLAGIYAE